MNIMNLIDDEVGGPLVEPFDYSTPIPNAENLLSYCARKGKATSELTDQEIAFICSMPKRKSA